MKMKSLAENMDKAEVSKGEPYYPSLYLRDSQIPSGLSEKIGAKGKIMLECRVSSISQDKMGGKSIGLDLLKIGMHEKAEKGGEY